MNENYDSLLEVAVALMKRKKKPQTLETVTKEVFQKKGAEKTSIAVAQFQADFMLSGYFVCCGEDKDGQHFWDLKARQLSTLLDKDAVYVEDLYADDEDVINNELKDEDFDIVHKNIDQYIDDAEDIIEEDDIEEELGLVDLSDDESTTTEIIADIDDEDEEEIDDIEESLK